MCIAKKRPISDPCFFISKDFSLSTELGICCFALRLLGSVGTIFSSQKVCHSIRATNVFHVSNVISILQSSIVFCLSIFSSYICLLHLLSSYIYIAQWNSGDMLFNDNLFRDFIGYNPSMILPPLTIFSPSDYLVMHPRGQDPRQRRMPKSPITPKHPAIHAAYTRALFPRAGGAPLPGFAALFSPEKILHVNFYDRP